VIVNNLSMRSKVIIKELLLIFFCIGCFAIKSTSQTSSIPLKIVWVTDLTGDFSFIKKWSYPEGIFKNKYGQLTCDGFCPDGIENMEDENGKIYKDSLKAYYKIVDTTHLFHTISCDAWCYEWAGTDFIDTYRKSNDTTFCATQLNVATHCSLKLTISGDSCIAIIDLISIVLGGNAKYYSTNGEITIDKNLWKKGILKAKFNFNFEHPENPKMPIYWKGKIYSRINSL
jgi:hypothetical protein